MSLCQRIRLLLEKDIKRLIYDAIYPGHWSIEKNAFTFLRADWSEKVFLDEEISVDNGKIYFTHFGEANIEYLYPNAELFYQLYNWLQKTDPLSKIKEGISYKVSNTSFAHLLVYYYEGVGIEETKKELTERIKDAIRYNLSSSRRKKLNDIAAGIADSIFDDAIPIIEEYSHKTVKCE